MSMSQPQVEQISIEDLAREVRELRKIVEDLVVKLTPLAVILEKLPYLMTDPMLFKSVAPALAIPYALERANVNMMGAAMVGGIECLSRSLENIASKDQMPELSIMKLLTDKELKRSLGMLMELLKTTMPCIHKNLREMQA